MATDLGALDLLYQNGHRTRKRPGRGLPSRTSADRVARAQISTIQTLADV